MSPRPLAPVRTVKRAHAMFDLSEHTTIMVDVLAKHMGKSRSEVVEDAVMCLYVTLPRPDDAKGGK